MRNTITFKVIRISSNCQYFAQHDDSACCQHRQFWDCPPTKLLLLLLWYLL